MDTTEEIPRFSYVSCAALTDVGRKRKNNEDNYGTFPDVGVFCVADGMGGARDGEVASRIVVEHLAGALRNWEKLSPPIPIEDRLALLDKCLDAASLWINQYAASHDASGCGTTFVGVVLDPGRPDHAVAVHAGDSRLYRIHRRKITQITRDHSVANMTGVKDEAELNPVFRNMILRAVGIKPTVELERTPFELASGDWVLICSDGLSKMLDDKSIAKIVTAAEGGKAAVHTLVAEANHFGGRDNITVILLHVGELPLAQPVHARLTEAEFLTCLGAGASDTAATTETAFTMPTGSSSTEQSAVGSVPAEEGEAANADGWLSDDNDSDNDSDNTPVPAAAGDGDGEAGSKKDEASSASAKAVPVASAPVESRDADTKTTEDIPPPPAEANADTKTTEDIPPPSAEANDDRRTTEDIPPPPVDPASRKRKGIPFILVAVALLAAGLGVGFGLWQQGREAKRVRQEEEARLAAVRAAEIAFSSRVDEIVKGLSALLAQISTAVTPQQYLGEVAAAGKDLESAWAVAQSNGVDKAVHTTALGNYGTASNKVATAVAARQDALRKAELLLAAIKAFKKDTTDVLAKHLSQTVLDGIAKSDNPDSFRDNVSNASKELDDLWDTANKQGVGEGERAWQQESLQIRAGKIEEAIADRTGALDAEFNAARQAFEERRDAKIADSVAYGKALDAIDAAANALPQYGAPSPWAAKYDALHADYAKLKASLVAPAAKIEVKNEGDAPLSVTLGGETAAIGKGAAHTFGNLAVWKSHRVSATSPEDYALEVRERSVGARGGNDVVSVSFRPVYKGDPKLVVKNGNAVAVKANGVEIKAGGTHVFENLGKPRAAFKLEFGCDDEDYEPAPGAQRTVSGKLANAGESQNVDAPKFRQKSSAVVDAKPQAGPEDAPHAKSPKAARSDKVAKPSKAEFEKAKREVQSNANCLAVLAKAKQSASEGGEVNRFFLDATYPAVTNLMPNLEVIRAYGPDTEIMGVYVRFETVVKALRDRTPQSVIEEEKDRIRRQNEGDANDREAGKQTGERAATEFEKTFKANVRKWAHW